MVRTPSSRPRTTCKYGLLGLVRRAVQPRFFLTGFFKTVGCQIKVALQKGRVVVKADLGWTVVKIDAKQDVVPSDLLQPADTARRGK